MQQPTETKALPRYPRPQIHTPCANRCTHLPHQAEEPIYLAIIWHQHQPVYFKDPDTGIYEKPWVRVHASKDYVDMAAMLKDYPKIHATFNLTPSLIYQLDDFQNGAKDQYWVGTEIPADSLSEEQKQFLLDRFFDTNRSYLTVPRYQELLEKRDAKLTRPRFSRPAGTFNLAWTDPDWLEEEPLASLVGKVLITLKQTSQSS
jgi:alpha-amylase/alpha-mannosidase (GH57 family)